MNNSVKVRVIPSRTRSSGYTLQWVASPVPKWICGPSNTWGWYRSKAAAQSRADTYNAPQAQEEGAK
jgi:hypothetical protein